MSVWLLEEVFFLFLAVILFPAQILAINSDFKIGKLLKSSIHLTRGYRGRIFGFVLIVTILPLVIASFQGIIAKNLTPNDQLFDVAEIVAFFNYTIRTLVFALIAVFEVAVVIRILEIKRLTNPNKIVEVFD